jgi:DNA polymerase III subunit epsilon
MATVGADLATPLVDVTFVVVDLETTGCSPRDAAITEVGAVKLRGGECVGTFQTLVNPGAPIPPDIVHLTGITESMVAPAPTIESVLPALAEFVGDAVVVGHNVRFDLGFLGADLERLGYAPLANRSIDTLALGRRLLVDDVPDCRLGTIARHLRTEADPNHRALADARATAEVLHRFLEQVGTIGVTALDDLLALPRALGHPQAAKLRWVADLPRAPGVYVLRDGTGTVLYVGRAANLRRDVRGHFVGREGRRIGPLLREAQALQHHECPNAVDAARLQARLLHEHAPRYNPEIKAARRGRVLALGPTGGRPAVVRRPARGDAALGPFATASRARGAAAALEAAVRHLTARAALALDETPDTVAGAHDLARALRRQRRVIELLRRAAGPAGPAELADVLAVTAALEHARSLRRCSRPSS